MIRVEPKPEPSWFDKKVRQPGLRAINKLCQPSSVRKGVQKRPSARSVSEIKGKELPAKWTKALPELRKAYGGVCAYLGARIPEDTGFETVDHYLHKSEHHALAYEWSNYRFALHRLNTNKDVHPVLDPFLVQDDWFELDIGDFKVRPAAHLQEPLATEVQQTITWLKLCDETFCKGRRDAHDRYIGLVKDRPLSFAGLEFEYPFVAKALRRQGKLLPGD